MTLKIIHNRPGCIGCAACAAIKPEFWAMESDGKSHLVDSDKIKNQDNPQGDDWEELEIDQHELDDNMMAAEVCPVNVIHIRDEDRNEDLI
ncbi:MAG: ferredoxin [DPANN group archaeon]|nr:ferredoxin [DPANN group archaeon]